MIEKILAKVDYQSKQPISRSDYKLLVDQVKLDSLKSYQNK